MASHAHGNGVGVVEGPHGRGRWSRELRARDLQWPPWWRVGGGNRGTGEPGQGAQKSRREEPGARADRRRGGGNQKDWVDQDRGTRWIRGTRLVYDWGLGDRVRGGLGGFCLLFTCACERA